MRKQNKGFTLVELLLVIAIIGILAAVLFVGLGNQRERARVTTFKENMRGLVTAYTACTDGGGTIGVGDTGSETPIPACDGGDSGVTGTLPKIDQCNGTGTVTIAQSTQEGSTLSGDSWRVAATCSRTAGDCVAECSADGCEFTGTCD